MLSFLELDASHATIIGIVLPIVMIIGFLIFNHVLKDRTASIRRYLSYLVNPPQIGTTDSVNIKREINVKPFFVYVGIALFLISFIIGEFYEVFLDILLPVTQGSTGEARIVTSVVFQSPFTAGWTGSMPWYGAFPLPTGWGTYHETWSWIFATAAFTDNPYFLDTTITFLLLVSFLVGLVFLAPLATKRIRHSFLSSMFFFTTGMVVFTKVAIGSFAQAWALLFGNAQIQIGVLVITGDMIPNLIDAITFGLPIILAMFAIFVLLGWKLWKQHYTDRESRRWFMLYIVLSFWLGLVLTILTV